MAVAPQQSAYEIARLSLEEQLLGRHCNTHLRNVLYHYQDFRIDETTAVTDEYGTTYHANLHGGYAVTIRQWDLSRASHLSYCENIENAHIRHQNLVLTYGLYDNHGFGTICERFNGVDLVGFMQTHRGIELQLKKWIAQSIMSGLAALHARGLVHGDLKADNVLVDDNKGEYREGGAFQCKVRNYNITSSRYESLVCGHNNASKMGRPDQRDQVYLAPELIETLAESSRFTDIYALGVLLYELASEQPLSKTPSVELGACPEAFAWIVSRCLSKDPLQRPLIPEIASVITKADAWKLS